MKSDSKVRQYRSDVVGRSVRMGIAEGAEAHITGILTEMYSDPELACIREYSTNARDSHVESGRDRAIEVTLPTPYLPTLVIRDYGSGLDESGITELYSQYGASSKRNTNSAQGMLGIGCKSALAYTDQFTVVGFKNGMRTQVIVSRDEDGAASQTIVGVDHGQYEDGVEVTIPVKSDNEIVDKAHTFFSFWPEGSVVLLHGGDTITPRRVGQNSGEDSEGNENRNIWLDDNTLLTNEVDEDLVVMGYVAYPLVDGDPPLFASYSAGRYDRRGRYVNDSHNAVCFVDIGEVNFAPSRESLMTTRRTKDKLAELREHVKTTFDASVRAQIAGASSAKEAQELLVAGIAMGFDNQGTPAQWNGRDVLLTLERKPPDGTSPRSYMQDWVAEDCLKWSYLLVNKSDYARKQGEREAMIDLQRGSLSIFTGFDTKWLTNVKRAKLELWAHNKGDVSILNRTLVFIDKLNKDEKFWTSGWPVYDWAEVEATQLPKSVDANGDTVRLKGSYNCIVDGEKEPGVPAHKIDTTKPVYYCHGNHWTASAHRAIRSGAVSLTGTTVVALSQNRIEKFKRDFPMAVELTDAAKEAASKWTKTIDADEIKAHAVCEHRAHYVLRALKGKDFDDPTLNTLIRLSSTDFHKYADGLTKFAPWCDVSTEVSVRKLIDNTMQKYPLVEWLGYNRPSGKRLEHIVLYLNAAIAAEKE